MSVPKVPVDVDLGGFTDSEDEIEDKPQTKAAVKKQPLSSIVNHHEVRVGVSFFFLYF